MKQYDVVKVIGFRDDRFESAKVHFLRRPRIGDIGTIVEVYSKPEVGYEIECCDSAGATIWLEALYPGELERANGSV